LAPSASPPTGTTGRAGIAEASTAGETSGRGAVPKRQDGETSTVDQSREWPYRDTAPRQDPAESRLDPIWGSNPPDAVRWHMDMTPGDKDPQAVESPGEESPSRPEARSRSQPAPATPNPRPEPDNGAVGSPPQPEAVQPSEGKAGEREHDQGDAGIAGSPAPQELLRYTERQDGHGAGGEVAEAVGSAAQQEGTRAQGAAGDSETGSSGSSPRHEQGPPPPAPAPRPDDHGGDNAIDAGGAAPPTARGSVGAQPGDGAPLAPTSQAHDSEPMEPVGSVDGSVGGPEAAIAGEGPPAPAQQSTPQAESGAEPRAEPRAEPALESGDRTPSEQPTSAKAASAGWFSTSADPAQVARTLSERLSAERPGAVPLKAPTPLDQASPGNAPGLADARGLAVAPLPTDHHAGAADGVVPVDSQAGEPGVGGPPSPSPVSGPVDVGAAADAESGGSPRSPEPISGSGMVYVDPDPEIGSPPIAAGWGEPSGPPQPSNREAAGDEARGAGPSELAAVTPAPINAVPIDPVRVGQMRGQADQSAQQERHQKSKGLPQQSQQDAHGQEHQDQHDAVDQQGDVNPQHQGLMSISVDDARSGDADGLAAAEVPWTEPALPMSGLPPDSPSPVREEGHGQHDGSPADEPLIPSPDPSWPRLFEQRQRTPSLGGTEVASGEVPPEPNRGVPPRAGSSPGTEARLDATAHSATTQGPAGPVGSTEGNGPAQKAASGEQLEKHSASGEQLGDHSGEQLGGHTEIVDLTTMKSSSAPGTTLQAGQPHHLPISSEARQQSSSVGAQTPEQANISTVARIADAEEVDLRDSPVGPPGQDVSRETSAGGGEGMDPTHEDEALEDEAALAVREAVSRAAAEAGVDVSRETEFMDGESPLDELGEEPSIDNESAARSARVSFRIHRETLNGTRRVVAVANQKGGVGKSTTAVNIGAYLALAGARVLVADLDPQGNASTGLGLDHRDIEPSIYDVLTGEAPPTAAIRPTGIANLHVLPSTIDLAGAEVELVSAMSRETRLRRALESIDHQYDTILIDCPPSLGLLTVNALAAANELLIPIQCEYYALEGLGQLLRNVELVRANLNPELRIGGIVLTMYDGRTRLALQVVDEVRKHFTDLVYQTVVPRSVRLSEAPGYGLPIALYDPLSRGGIAYRDLTFELAERSGLLAPTGEGAS
jgi:chromosome partitioning protein